MEEIKTNTKYQILTPHGFEDFYGIRKIQKPYYIKLRDYDLKCSDNHRLLIYNEWKVAKELENDIIDGSVDLYDPVGIKSSSYYSNECISHNCDFIGSTNTLLSSVKLKSLVFKEPIYKDETGLKVYEEPKIGHTYVMTVDTARGTGSDYHAFVVIDITRAPYKVVTTFRNNEISPMVYPNIIYPVAQKYNDSYVLIEINDIGGQVADLLHKELEYDNILMTTIRGRKGQTIDGGFGAADSQLGIRTTKAVKRLGCSLLRTFIEDDKLIFYDYNIVKELVSYVAKNHSFEADVGHNDDLISCLVLFCWLSTQGYFSDLTNMNIRRQVFDEKLKQIEEELTPFGFIENGIDPDLEIDDQGIGWVVADPFM